MRPASPPAASRTSATPRSTVGRAGAHVIGKAEWTEGEANPRFVATSLGKALDQRPLSLREGLLRPRRNGEPRSARATCSPTGPRPPPCAPTSSGCGSPRSPTFLICAVRRVGLAHTQFADATAARSGSSSSSSRASSASARDDQVRPRLGLPLRHRMAPRRRPPRPNRLRRRRGADQVAAITPRPIGEPKQPDNHPRKTAPRTRSSFTKTPAEATVSTTAAEPYYEKCGLERQPITLHRIRRRRNSFDIRRG